MPPVIRCPVRRLIAVSDQLGIHVKKDRCLKLASVHVLVVRRREPRRLPGVRPAGADNLCHQAIFMKHAPCAVTPLDPELIQVCHAVGQRAQRRGLA